jgi:hypothetical protein
MDVRGAVMVFERWVSPITAGVDYKDSNPIAHPEVANQGELRER